MSNTKWEYLESLIHDGGEDRHSLTEEMDTLGADGWEFCDWTTDWVFSQGPGPSTRGALFKRPVAEVKS